MSDELDVDRAELRRRVERRVGADSLRILESEQLSVDVVAGPAGRFVLQTTSNPAHCPACGEWVARLWLFVPAGTTRHVVVACDTCVEP